MAAVYASTDASNFPAASRALPSFFSASARPTPAPPLPEFA
eukprot:CAMPEP_0171659396 /NCGR_PEP_ID=MMETSP0990-20121206/43573_1 /TAXON_ID=483369 /ORGANISM="non described non described, Strain CCMP2098" /LENGTH=40 /DNA_ID= /DNA_START= /DNA_END= /DNA_ORIENTATION=